MGLTCFPPHPCAVPESPGANPSIQQHFPCSLSPVQAAKGETLSKATWSRCLLGLQRSPELGNGQKQGSSWVGVFKASCPTALTQPGFDQLHAGPHLLPHKHPLVLPHPEGQTPLPGRTSKNLRNCPWCSFQPKDPNPSGPCGCSP